MRANPHLRSTLVAVLLLVGPAGGAGPARAAPAPLPDRDAAADCPDGLEVLVERPFARERGVAPGDVLQVLPRPDGEPCPARVAGVFEPRPDPSRLTVDRPRILFHLPHLARLAGREGEVDRFSVALAPGIDPVAAAAGLERLLPGAEVLDTSRVVEEASTTFRVVERFHRAIGIITLTAGGVFLACIMILKVQERRPAVAALRLIGISRRTLLAWVVAEAALVAVAGGVSGIALGRVASGVINRHYAEAYDTTLVFSLITPDILLVALGLGLGLGLAAGVAAALRLLAADPLVEVGR